VLKAAACAYDITPDGSVIAGFVNNGTQAFRWTESGGYQFITPLSPVSFGYEPRVSADGTVFLSGSTYWTASRGVLSIQQVLAEAGCDFSGWSITAATGLSFDGRVICGEGIDPQGQRQAWVATVPAPGSLCWIGFASLAALRRRRHRQHD